MSRGGRGGFGGGRGGRNSSTKVAGVDIPWEFAAGEDPAALLKAQQVTPDLFPTIRVYRPAPATSHEWACVQSYKSIRESVHDSPYYAILGDTNTRVSKSKRASATPHVEDPFEGGMTTFSHRYKKIRRKIPNLGAREYSLRFFPKELWPLLDTSNIKGDDDGDGTKPGRKRALMDDDDDDNAGSGSDDDDEDLLSEDLDDDYEEDEDDPDDDNDYNAEKYFDGGEDGDGDDE